MRIAIQTFGTRGDIQPYLALACGLIGRGHEVQLAGPEQFTAMARERGVRFAPLPGDLLALIDTPQGRAAVAGGKGFSAGFRLLRHVRPLMRRLLDAEWAAVSPFRPDLILHHPKSLATPHMARALGCGALLASPLPVFAPTAAFPTPIAPWASLGPLNRLSHIVADKAAGRLFSGTVRDWREGAPQLAAGGESAGRARRGALFAYSAHVLPKPPDWGADICVSGYWFLDTPGWTMPAELAAFLAQGEPPIYIGFGSMPGLDPQAATALVIEALTRTGSRGLLALGGGALVRPAANPDVHVVADAPHDRLFPHMAAAIHHGGAGTSAAMLRAGIPGAVVPFFGDQPFWARRLQALGVAPKPLDRSRLSVEALAGAMSAVREAGLRERAAALGALIRAEDGVAAAIAFIESRMRPQSR